jgi:hypothetical protein
VSNIDVKETRLFALRALKDKFYIIYMKILYKFNLRREFAVGTVTMVSQNI